MPFADNYTKTTYVNQDVQATGTPDVDAQNLNNNETGLKSVFTALSSLFASHEALDAQVDTLGTSYVDNMFIGGLKVEWVSGTQIRIKSGACYVPAAGAIGAITSDVTITPTLAASTWYYVYSIYASGSLTFEAVTTVPVLYSGTAKQKTGDSSRRYIGSFLTNAAAAIMRFSRTGDRVSYLENPMASPLLAVSLAGTISATTEQTVSCASRVPPTASEVELYALLDSAASASRRGIAFGTPEDAITLGSANDFPPPASLFWFMSDYNVNIKSAVFSLPLGASQSFTWRRDGDSGTGGEFYVGIRGYKEER